VWSAEPPELLFGDLVVDEEQEDEQVSSHSKTFTRAVWEAFCGIGPGLCQCQCSDTFTPVYRASIAKISPASASLSSATEPVQLVKPGSTTASHQLWFGSVGTLALSSPLLSPSRPQPPVTLPSRLGTQVGPLAAPRSEPYATSTGRPTTASPHRSTRQVSSARRSQRSQGGGQGAVALSVSPH
jgi:hypothetical protein